MSMRFDEIAEFVAAYTDWRNGQGTQRLFAAWNVRQTPADRALMRAYMADVDVLCRTRETLWLGNSENPLQPTPAG